MNFLEKIITQKQSRLEEARKFRPIEELKSSAFDFRSRCKPHAFREALQQNRINIIAEIKRASPSRGTIREDASAPEIAKSYESGGAAAISILTEEDNFHGSLDDLRSVRSVTELPLLRKDFIFDEFQLYEAADAGADALLLIVAALDDQQLQRLRSITESDLAMDALVEVHSRRELERAISCGAVLLGVNNRDLRTLKVSLQTSVDLARDITPERTFISESGLRTRADLDMLRALDYKGFLIGEMLMGSNEPGDTLSTLLNQE